MAKRGVTLDGLRSSWNERTRMASLADVRESKVSDLVDVMQGADLVLCGRVASPELVGYQTHRVFDLLDGDATVADYAKVGEVAGYYVRRASMYEPGHGKSGLSEEYLATMAEAILKLKQRAYGTPGYEAFVDKFERTRARPSPDYYVDENDYVAAHDIAYCGMLGSDDVGTSARARGDLDAIACIGARDRELAKLGGGPGTLGVMNGMDATAFATPDAWREDLVRREAVLARWLPVVDDPSFNSTLWDGFNEDYVQSRRETLCELAAAGGVSAVSAGKGSRFRGMNVDLMNCFSGNERTAALGRGEVGKLREQLATIRAEFAAEAEGRRPFATVAYRADSGEERTCAIYTEAAAKMYVSDTIYPATDLTRNNPRWRGAREDMLRMRDYSRFCRGLARTEATAAVARAVALVGEMSGSEAEEQRGLGE